MISFVSVISHARFDTRVVWSIDIAGAGKPAAFRQSVVCPIFDVTVKEPDIPPDATGVNTTGIERVSCGIMNADVKAGTMDATFD